ncbi:MAG: hypothetical protein KY443_01320 [Actinobacteria bacterium]|nr:hypothetical protein [Actinomycetota bacterium]
MSIPLTHERQADAPPVDLAVESSFRAASGAVSRRVLPPALRAGSPVWVWAGVVASVVGLALIGIGWGKVAGETQVYLQLPYLVSAGLTGLVFVMVGLTVLNVTTRQRDGAERDRQITELVGIIEELRETLAERPKR